MSKRGYKYDKILNNIFFLHKTNLISYINNFIIKYLNLKINLFKN